MVRLQRVVFVNHDYVHGVHADEHALEVERAPDRGSVPRGNNRGCVVAGGVRAESWSGRNPRAASAHPKAAQLICVAADRSTNLTTNREPKHAA